MNEKKKNEEKKTATLCEPDLLESSFDPQLKEAFDDLWNRLVDPEERLNDGEGPRWSELSQVSPGACDRIPFGNEGELAEIRRQCRTLATTNEFAINGHENRISYIVGSGHKYRVTEKRGVELPENLLRETQNVIDEFVRRNHWHRRQQEIVRRKDRDGECFLRLFFDPHGESHLRFVEPDQVTTPAERSTEPAASFGIQTASYDVEQVLGYWIDGQLVASESIQHRKANVDSNVKRGLPLFFPVQKNLRRAEKILRNMSVVSEIQSAIAIIRKHKTATRGGLEQFVASQADASVTGPQGNSHYRRFAPGTILDALAGTEYEFPAAGIDASRFVAVLQAELRAIASRLVMPEFMLSSDASNANYASTMVAEGPAVKMYERLQYEMLEEDLELMHRVVAHAVSCGLLPAESLTSMEIRGIAPTLAVRDRLRDAEADQILVQCQAMSIQTMSLRHGLDAEHEQQGIARQKLGQNPAAKEEKKIAPVAK